MPIRVTLPEVSEDEAYNFLVASFPENINAGSDVSVSKVISQYLNRLKPPSPTGGMVQYELDMVTNSWPFYNAASRLCSRGILAQKPTRVDGTKYTTIGDYFTITEYGSKWFSRRSQYDCAPAEYGRFTQLLSNHSARLGPGYDSRSKEAISCYRAQTYLACCVMCGAAAESIILALAIAKKGDAEEVLKGYCSSGGRGRIEKLLMVNQDGHIIKNLPNYTSLINDWRDVAAHGSNTYVGEEEAFTALLLLLRFARFADERWDSLTNQ